MEPDVARIVKVLIDSIPEHLLDAISCFLDDETSPDNDFAGYRDTALIANAIEEELWHQALLRGERMYEVRLL